MSAAAHDYRLAGRFSMQCRQAYNERWRLSFY